MKSRRYKYSRYAMYTAIEKVIKSKKLKPGKCLLIGDSIKGKGNDKIKIRNPAITNMLPNGCEILAPSYPDVDIHKMPYEDNTFDYVIADQVLEHVRKPWIGVEEVRRVLKPGGLAILTSALIFPVHGVPHDYWRFTPEGLKVLCENFSKIHECAGAGSLPFVMDILRKQNSLKVNPKTDLEKKALVCDNKHLVSVWIIAEK
jgi:SAM-dependent methyltransferase